MKCSTESTQIDNGSQKSTGRLLSLIKITFESSTKRNIKDDICLVVSVSLAGSRAPGVEGEFLRFKEKFNKVYSSSAEEEKRFNIFQVRTTKFFPK